MSVAVLTGITLILAGAIVLVVAYHLIKIYLNLKKTGDNLNYWPEAWHKSIKIPLHLVRVLASSMVAYPFSWRNSRLPSATCPS